MLGTKPLLLSLLGVSTIGGVVTGGYFLFKPETSTVSDNDKEINSDGTADEAQTDLTTKTKNNDQAKPIEGQGVLATSNTVGQEPAVASGEESQTGRSESLQN